MARTQKATANTVSYYKRHIFFCVNDCGLGADRPSCACCGSQEMRDYAKARVKDLGLSGEGQVRVNRAGCLDRCAALAEGLSQLCDRESTEEIRWYETQPRGFRLNCTPLEIDQVFQAQMQRHPGEEVGQGEHADALGELGQRRHRDAGHLHASIQAFCRRLPLAGPSSR